MQTERQDEAQPVKKWGKSHLPGLWEGADSQTDWEDACVRMRREQYSPCSNGGEPVAAAFFPYQEVLLERETGSI